jgi:hypothetical protein
MGIGILRMMRFSRQIPLFALAAVGLAAGGCRLLDDGVTMEGRSPLKSGRPSPDSVALEMMWVRFADGDPLLNDEAWLDIDELPVSADVRRELANNGFRVGVIRGTLPDAMARALDQRGSAMADAADGSESAGIERVTINTEELLAAEPMEAPKVRGHTKQLRRNERWDIQASDVYPSLPLLETYGRVLGGEIFADAQGVYALRAHPQGDRTVILELTPELHYGPYRQRYSSEAGVMMQASMRDRKVFSQLKMNVRLSPGEMLVLMNLPNAGSRLGEYFHTVESPSGRQQKLILLRLAQMPSSDVFDRVSE